MATGRSHDEILDQMIFAVACVANHYGPALNADGLAEIRKLLGDSQQWWCGSHWLVDVLEGGEDGNPDFCPKVIPFTTPAGLDFDEVVRQSRTGED